MGAGKRVAAHMAEQHAEQHERLNDEQVENWRKVLCQTIGPYALIAPREQIQSIRDNMQAQALKQADVTTDAVTDE